MATFSIVDAAREPLQNNLAYRLYDLWRSKGRKKYLLGAFHYTLPIVGQTLTKMQLHGQDWEDALAYVSVKLYEYQKEAHWQVEHPGGYYYVIVNFSRSKTSEVLKRLWPKELPPEEWMPYGYPHGSLEHPESVLAAIYVEEIHDYVRKRVPELVRCRRRERDAIPFAMDQLLRGVQLRTTHLNGSVKTHRRKLLMDRIAVACRRAMYELEDDSGRHEPAVRSAIKRTWHSTN